MNILSIESSCDDSSIALQNMDCKLLWHRKISQETAHFSFGGVVPELASRLFARDLPYLLERFIRDFSLDKVDSIAITNEPGLATSLLEGLMLAKGLAISLNIPLVGINHLKGHIYSLFIDKKEVKMPLSVLLVSGGHTMIVECYGYDDMKIIASTLDDSFGECYDKAAKILSLGYPGGAIIDSLACNALKEGIKAREMPIPLYNSNRLCFSFSGLKNAFRLALQREGKLLKLIESNMVEMEKIKQEANNLSIDSNIANSLTDSMYKNAILQHESSKALALGLQTSAVAHIVQKCKQYLKNAANIPYFAIVGGASANTHLRASMQDLAREFNKELLLSSMRYCSDNAAMIGRAAIARIESNGNVLKKGYLDVDISTINTEIR